MDRLAFTRYAVVILPAVAVCSMAFGADEMSPESTSIPFPKVLADADIRVAGLNSVLDDALLIGNGDINALVWTEQGRLTLMLTKNDVWDARLMTEKDPPLPTLARVKALGRAGNPIKDPILPAGVTWSGKDCYHTHAYPCPRACARLVFGGGPATPFWRQIRAQGKHNVWERRGNVTVMSIEGGKEASNGYAFEPLAVTTDDYPKLRIRLSGSENARWFVDVMGPGREALFNSGWIETPTQPAERVFDLPVGKTIRTVILYTWTEDGKRAENRFETVRFEGPAGKKDVDLSVKPPATSPARLDLRRAFACVEGRADGPTRSEIRALADRNVFLIRSPVDAQLLDIKSADLPAATRGEDRGVVWVRQVIPGDLDWPGMRFAVAVARRGEQKAVAIVTSVESKDELADAVKLARSTVEADASQLVGQHEKTWQRFWSRSGIRVNDALLQRTWYRSLYFLRCVSKPGVVCPGLFAGLINDTPAWHGDYHTNYNLQQTFWAAYSANHAELAEPYDRLMSEYLPRGRWLAGQVFSMQGAYYPHVLFAYEPANPEACKSVNGRQYIHHVWGMTIGVNGFSVQPLWWHYKYAPDRKLLETTVYPVVREVGRFYAEFIEQCEGGDTVRLGPSVSPEHWGWTRKLERNYDCAFDIAMVRYTLSAAIEGAQTLGCDGDLVARFESALKRLPPYPLHGTDDPIVVDVAGAPPITYNISVPATPVFPCDVVTWRSPADVKALFVRTIDGLKWNGNNATVMLAVARARLSMPGTQAWLRDEVNARTRPNGTMTLNRLDPPHGFNDFGHYTEQFGTGMAVSELLVQSVGDVVRLFPAVAPEGRASFENLRTQGGFLVSAGIERGSIASFKITSTVGGPLRLLSPWPTVEVRRHGRGPYEPLTPDKQRIVRLDTEPGETLAFRIGPARAAK